MLTFRPATPDDLDAIMACDPAREGDAGRRATISAATEAGQCHVALDEGRVVGYAILAHHFFGESFVQLLFVAPEHRRQGIGAALMGYLATQRRSAKLFTSTNLSNQPMQRLLARLGYTLSGVIHDLDEGDPELVYVKRWNVEALKP